MLCVGVEKMYIYCTPHCVRMERWQDRETTCGGMERKKIFQWPMKNKSRLKEMKSVSSRSFFFPFQCHKKSQNVCLLLIGQIQSRRERRWNDKARISGRKCREREKNHRISNNVSTRNLLSFLKHLFWPPFHYIREVSAICLLERIFTFLFFSVRKSN